MYFSVNGTMVSEQKLPACPFSRRCGAPRLAGSRPNTHVGSAAIRGRLHGFLYLIGTAKQWCNDLIDKPGHCEVTLADAARIVRRQPDLDPIIYVAPFGMMISLIGFDTDLDHHRHSLREGCKLQAAVERTASSVMRPGIMNEQRMGDLIVIQSGFHGDGSLKRRW